MKLNLLPLLLSTSTALSNRFSLSPAGFPLSNSTQCAGLCTVSSTCTFYVWNSEDKTCSLSDKDPVSAVEVSGLMSGAGEVSLDGVLMLSEVEIFYLERGDSGVCVSLCQGTCLRSSWREEDRSCVLDHRQDTRGLTQLQETAKRAKPKRRGTGPRRKSTKKQSPPPPTPATAMITPRNATTTTSPIANNPKKNISRKKTSKRKPSSKQKSLLNEELESEELLNEESPVAPSESEDY